MEAGARAAEFAEEAKGGTAKVMKSVKALKELVKNYNKAHCLGSSWYT